MKNPEGFGGQVRPEEEVQEPSAMQEVEFATSQADEGTTFKSPVVESVSYGDEGVVENPTDAFGVSSENLYLTEDVPPTEEEIKTVHRAAHVQHSEILVLAADQPELVALDGPSDAMTRSRLALRVGAEQRGAGFRDPENLDNLRFGKLLGNRIDQGVGRRGAAHGGQADKGVVPAREKVALLKHHGEDRRHAGDHRHAVAGDGIDIAAGIELAHQHDR